MNDIIESGVESAVSVLLLRTMEGMEQSAYILHQQAEQLGDRLRTYRPPFYSLNDAVDRKENS